MKEIKGMQVLESLDEIVEPKHTAVIVVDIQNDNASPKGAMATKGKGIAWIREVIPQIKVVLAEARRFGLLIVFLRMTRTKDARYEAPPRLRLHERTTQGLSEYEMEGTWGNEVLDELEPRQGEPQIIKYRSSSFIGTPLDLLLRNRGIKAAVVVGLVTEGCVETTVRDLEQYGYYPVVLSDCVRSSRPELHEAALKVMAHRYDVVDSRQVLDVWRSRTGAPQR